MSLTNRHEVLALFPFMYTWSERHCEQYVAVFFIIHLTREVDILSLTAYYAGLCFRD